MTSLSLFSLPIRSSFASTTKRGRLGQISLPRYRNRSVASCSAQCFKR